MKLLIAGSRDFDDYERLREVVDRLLSNTTEDIELLSGGARGADTLAERYAAHRNIPFICYPANWNEHGKAAGYIRNQEMANIATHAVIFWDGQSRGTSHMISLCKKHEINLRVIKV